MRARSLGFPVALLTGVVLLALLGVPGGPPARAQTPPAPTFTPLPGRPAGAPAIPVPPRPLPPVALDRLDVRITIDDELAATSMSLVFKNATDRPQEATLLFPVPPGVAVSDFTLAVDGQTLEGELLGRDEAARIYTGIVQRQRDPALLEYVGQNVLRARVFPVPPRGESTLTLRFSQLVVPENGALRYRLPLSAGADVGPALSRLTIAARVSHQRGVRSLFSPTHAMRFTPDGETAISATYEETGGALRGTFELDALLAGSDVAAGMVTYRAGGEDGFFMLWLAPPLRRESVVDKDVLLVLDISGSMSGRKIEQAKAALRSVLGRLNPGDRFNVIAFSSDVSPFATGLRPVSEANAAVAYVDRLRAEGGTNINDALLTALQGVDRGRLTTVLFLTDGEPTAGETSAARILENVRAAAPDTTRLFVFGVGDDVNTLLLDGLAVQNHGDVSYVRPDEDVEEAVSGLYGRISAPQLTDLRLDFGGALVSEVYPRPLPDLFGGQTLFVTGRYRDPGTFDVRLSGNRSEGEQSFTFSGLELAANDRRASYLPRLWASRRVGALLREIRLNGPERSRELIEEVTALGTRYGIVTPYTSFLAIEPGAMAPTGPGGPRPTPARAPTALPFSGAPAVAAAATAGALANATPAPARTATPAATAARSPAAVPGAPPAPPALEIQNVGDKSFVLRDGVWVDTAYQPGTETFKVQFASDAYVELLLNKPELAPFFAIGERVIVVLGDVAYEVTS